MKNILYTSFMFCFMFVFSQEKGEISYKEQTYKIDTLSINTENSDFGINYINDKEVVFSSPKKSQLFARKWEENGQQFLELYKGIIASDGTVEDVEIYSKYLNSKHHEAELVFTKNKKTVYFTSNNQSKGKEKKSSDGYNNLQLYKADVVLGEYENIELLPFNNKEYSTGHPFLSDDGKTLYFVSDRPGGYGQTDLYKVSVLRGNKFGKVINLGSRINTSGKEMFPFIDIDKTLYFSSDREGTKGGLDVYGISLKNLEDTIYQLPSPINSIQDDFAFVLGKYQYGFLSSNREGGKGDDDIYKLTFDCLQYLKGKVFSTKNKELIKGATVYLYENNKVLDSVETDEKGAFESLLPLSCNSDYMVKATKFNFENDSVNVATPAKRLYENKVSLNLTPTGCMQALSGKVYNEKTKEALREANVYIYSNNVLLDSVLTDINGQFSSSLRMKCGSGYIIKATKSKFREKLTSLETSLIPHFENDLDIALAPYFLDNKIDIAPIYFDLNKAYIRPDAAEILDEVVDVMNKYPNLIVEGGSHTDSRGNDAYNEDLSARRAKSTVAYIISKGISSDRITSKGYGESLLINRCINGVKCSKEEHQLNRRTEFKIISY